MSRGRCSRVWAHHLQTRCNLNSKDAQSAPASNLSIATRPPNPYPRLLIKIVQYVILSSSLHLSKSHANPGSVSRGVCGILWWPDREELSNYPRIGLRSLKLQTSQSGNDIQWAIKPSLRRRMEFGWKRRLVLVPEGQPCLSWTHYESIDEKYHWLRSHTRTVLPL
jgi:hypothetical protein